MVSPADSRRVWQTHLQPQVVGHPTATTKSEKLPLVATHSHILQSSVDDLGLAWRVLVLIFHNDYPKR